MKQVTRALRFMTTFLFSTLAACAAGIWLDGLLDTTPWILFLLLAYAIGGNFYLLWKGLDKDE